MNQNTAKNKHVQNNTKELKIAAIKELNQENQDTIEHDHEGF